MRLAIVNITAGGISGGYRQYLDQMLPLLSAHPKADEILCVCPDTWPAEKWFGAIPNVTFTAERPARLLSGGSPALRRALDKFSPDIVFVPVEKPFSYGNIPVVHMLQNMWPMVNHVPVGDFRLKLRMMIQRGLARKALVKSDHVIAVTGFVRDFLVSDWKIPEEKIDVVHYGMTKPDDSEGVKPEAVEREFIFAAGSIREDRGLEDLILAVKEMDFDTLGIGKVIVAGGEVPGQSRYRNYLKRLMDEHQVASRFVFLGDLDASGMAWCYRNCRCFVMTSRVESFGFIGLEAMANGCVCVAADNPCLPEIFEDAAFYYEPKNFHALAGILKKAAGLDHEQTVRMKDRARERAASFSWEKTVEKTIGVFEKALAGRQ